LFEADRRTIARWRVFWREHFPQTSFWKVARSRFVPKLAISGLPRVLLDAFLRSDDPREDWKHLLEFLSPITVTGGLLIEGIS
jgi:hypothetical protein